MATTFYWNDTDIRDKAPQNTEIIISNIYRPLRKPVTRHKVEIPGRAGSWDFGGGVEMDFPVSVDIVITANDSAGVMSCAAAIEGELTGKGALKFSDRETVTYQAQTFSEITLTPEGAGNIARATIEFECDA